MLSGSQNRGNYLRMMQMNAPDLWKDLLPRPRVDGHKYDRGHCIVVGGAKLTGAARLAGVCAARAGAGLVTIVAPQGVGDVYRTAAPAHIMVEDEIAHDRRSHLADARRRALVLGPGFGADADAVIDWLKARGDQRLVLDADGLIALNARAEGLALLRPDDVLTPHAGEFARLFGDCTAQEAARRVGCVVVLKGADTIIADGEDGVENRHASPYLASAGTGDALAGIIAGLMAQGMPSFKAACAGVWMHGEAGLQFGPGLVASDIPDMLPHVLKSLFV